MDAPKRPCSGILRYLEDEAFRPRTGIPLNKGEALHALRRFLFLANEGLGRRGGGSEGRPRHQRCRGDDRIMAEYREVLVQGPDRRACRAAL